MGELWVGSETLGTWELVIGFLYMRWLAYMCISRSSGGKTYYVVGIFS